ncbi:RICIN domain-containing protein [Streptomyces sp. PA5.6]|uniref:RICIN domain-containing protein n=1 Tax=Streptomyces sp. PA5.6 TaxID=3035651 RepID=UPI003904A124
MLSLQKAGIAASAALVGLAVAVLPASAADGPGSPVERQGRAGQRLSAQDGDGWGYMRFAHSGKCADLPGWNTGNGVQLDQWSCASQANLWWGLRFVTNDTVEVVNHHSRKCMNVKGASTANRAKVVQWPCNGQANARWYVDQFSDGTLRLKNVKSGKCLNVEGADTRNGADLIQWSCSGAANNRFAFID